MENEIGITLVYCDYYCVWWTWEMSLRCSLGSSGKRLTVLVAAKARLQV